VPARRRQYRCGRLRLVRSGPSQDEVADAGGVPAGTASGAHASGVERVCNPLVRGDAAGPDAVDDRAHARSEPVGVGRCGGPCQDDCLGEVVFLGPMADNESDSSRKLAEAVLAQNSDNVLAALRFAREHERLSKKGDDSAAADAWNRVARAIALIELERIRLMLGRGPA